MINLVCHSKSLTVDENNASEIVIYNYNYKYNAWSITYIAYEITDYVFK